jgi:replicative DNA helicase
MGKQALAKRDRVAPSVISLDNRFDPLLQIADERSEEALIGAVFQQPDLYPALAEIAQPADFFFLKNGYVWHACDSLSGRGVGIDLITVAEEMETLNAPIKGEELIRELARMIGGSPDTRNAEQYAWAVYQAALRLRLMSAAGEIAKLAPDKTVNVDALVDECDRLIFKATNRQAEKRTNAKDIMVAYHAKVEQMLENGTPAPGVQLGFKALDDLSGGLYPGEVTVLAGGEGMGKTTWALSTGRNMGKAGARVAVFTLEMSQEEIIRIFTAMETGIFKSVLKAFTLSDYQWGLFTKAAGDIARWPMDIIDEYPTLTPVQLRRKLRNLSQTGDIDAVIIDGLWLMEASEPTGERWRDVGNIMRDLNQVARDFSVPILLTHQYNAEIKNVKYPTLFNLSESAGVRRNAQVVWGLHRATYYNRDADDNTTELYILKDRNGGSVGQKLPFTYNTDFSRYEGGAYVG